MKRDLFVRGPLVLVAAAVLVMAGCGDDRSTSTTDDVVVSLAVFDQLIDSIVPPAFDVPVGVSPFGKIAADTSYGYWAGENNPLLGKVFGETEPMALHRNQHRLGDCVQWMHRVRALGDTTVDGVQTSQGECNGTMTVTRLQGETDIPVMLRAVLGDTALQLQHRIQIQIGEQTQSRISAGVRQDDTCDVLLAYQEYPAPDAANPNAYEYSLLYAYRNHERDSVQVRAVHFRAYNNTEQQCAMWAYQVASTEGGGFFYRMTWYADDFADGNGLGCVVGTGQSREQFVLRYQQMTPAEQTEPDSLDPFGHLCHMFGPGYADQGISITAGWEEATSAQLMYRYQHMPMGLKYVQAGAEDAFDPWN